MSVSPSVSSRADVNTTPVARSPPGTPERPVRRRDPDENLITVLLPTVSTGFDALRTSMVVDGKVM